MKQKIVLVVRRAPTQTPEDLSDARDTTDATFGYADDSASVAPKFDPDDSRIHTPFYRSLPKFRKRKKI